MTLSQLYYFSSPIDLLFLGITMLAGTTIFYLAFTSKDKPSIVSDTTLNQGDTN